MRNEKQQIARSTRTVGLIAVAFILLSGFFMQMIIREQHAQTERYLFEIAQQCKNIIRNQIRGDLQALQGMAAIIGQNEQLDIRALVPVLTDENSQNHFKRLAYIDTVGRSYVVEQNGKVHYNVDYFYDREYVKQALSGAQYVSETLEDRLGGGLINCYSVPIYHDQQLIGALCAVNSTETFREILDSPIFDNVGFSYIINSSGDLVVSAAHPDADHTLQNIFDMTFVNKQGKQQVQAGMESGQSGSFSFVNKGQTNWATYLPIGIKDWIILSVVPQQAVNVNFNRIILLAVFLLLGIIILFYILLEHINTIMRRGREEITRLAYYDPLTGIYNKTKFMMAAQDVLQRQYKDYALVVFDIGNFKFINELFGFSEGDILLKHISQVLRCQIREGEPYFRDTADRFGALLSFDNRQALINRIRYIMEQISGYSFKNAEKYGIVCCCGVRVIEAAHTCRDMDILLDSAAFALGKAKGSHINSYAFYDNELHEKATWKNKMESEMRSAVENDEFVVYLQPKYSLCSKKIVGSEALVRWYSPTYGMLPPNTFIPVFEQNGFIIELDMYVLRTVCRTLRRWLDEGYEVFPVSVNQSRLLFYQDHYLESLHQILQTYDIPPSLIILEITESIAVVDMDVIQKILGGIHRLGFIVSMDDFGSGYSSLNVLQDIKIDELKLDKAFLNSKNSMQKEYIIRKIVELTKELSIATVAEGVETIEQVEFLETIGCDVAQGYYFAKPMALDAFESLAFGTETVA